MPYIDPDMIGDETAVAEAGLAGVADRIPGFTPQEGHIVTPIAEATGVAIATAVNEVKASLKDAYNGFGQRILGLPIHAAGVATAPSTWVLTDDDGWTIPAGIEVEAFRGDGTSVLFAVAVDVDVAPGQTTATGVQLIAIESGPDSNGAVGAATVEPTGADGQGITRVASVTLTAPSTNGADAEDPDDYADRLAQRSQRRLHLLPVEVAGYAAAALDVTGIVRARAVNRLDPAHPADDTAGHVTIYTQIAGGTAPTGTIADALEAYFDQTERPVRTTIHLAGAALVDVAVLATVRAGANVDAADLKARAEAAITTRLAKATWDYDQLAPGLWGAPSTALNAFDISAAIDDLPGLVGISTITLNGAASVALPGPLSIPNLISVAVTVL